jgi:hypothetical protein
MTRLRGIALFFALLGVLVGVEPSPVQAQRTLRVHIQLSSINLDPSTMADIESRKIATMLHAGLIALNQDGSIEPRAAISWVRRDERTWVFTLKPDLRFSDGAPVNAASVVQSLCDAMQPTHLWSWSLASIEHVSGNVNEPQKCTGILAEGNDVVVIRETRPTEWLFDALSGPGGWIVQRPTNSRQPFGNVIGIGPYVIDRVEPDAQVTLRARRDSSATTEPLLDAVTFQMVSDPARAAQQLLGGSLDLLEVSVPGTYRALMSAGNSRPDGTRINVVTHKLARLRTILLNPASFRRKGFSEALFQQFRTSYSNEIDRDRVRGLAPWTTSVALSALPDFSVRSTASLKHEEPLPAAEITLLVNNDAFSDQIAASLPTHVGNVRVKYRAVDFSVIITEVLAGSYDAVLLSLDATIDAPPFWMAFWRQGAPFVLFGRALPEVTSLDLTSPNVLEVARPIVDGQGAWIPLFTESGTYALNSRAAGLRLTKSGQWSLELLRLAGS